MSRDHKIYMKLYNMLTEEPMRKQTSSGQRGLKTGGPISMRRNWGGPKPPEPGKEAELLGHAARAQAEMQDRIDNPANYTTSQLRVARDFFSNK